jgi:glycine/serine hydroxymethyltransferase
MLMCYMSNTLFPTRTRQNAFSPGGIRIGTPALTSRGMKEADVVHVAAFLDRCIQLTISIQVGAITHVASVTHCLPCICCRTPSHS